MKFTFEIGAELAAVCPQLLTGVIAASVSNSDTSDALWQQMSAAADDIAATYELLAINDRAPIAATRRVYRALGKDPGRYRVASEQLCRRVVRGLGLYRSTALIDLVNLVSMASGYPISGLDADKVVGDSLTMGVGKQGEEYHGIGRGVLNIAGMPVWRDAAGGIATPTSDHERTKFDDNTTRVLILVNDFHGNDLDELTAAVRHTIDLLRQHAAGTAIEAGIVQHSTHEFKPLNQ